MKGYGETTYVVITVLLTSRPFLAVEVYQFTRSPGPDIIENQTITLVCKYNRSTLTSTRPATTKFTRNRNDKEEDVASFQDGLSIIEDGYGDRFQLDHNGNLLINITRYDTGIYKCEVEIFDDTPKRSAKTLNITVCYADKPTIDMPSHAMVGDSIEIICNISDAHPQPFLQIYNNQNQTVEFSNGRFINFTKKATKHDAGEYYCVARNKAGNKTTDSRKLTIYFIEVPELVIVNVSNDNSYNIECQSPASVPVPKLYITHNNETIKNTTGLNLTYHLETATKDDEGYYQCIARNFAGETNSEIQKLVVDTRSTDIGKTPEARVTLEENKSFVFAVCVGVILIVLVVIGLLAVYCKFVKAKNKRGSRPKVALFCYKECVKVPTSQNSGELDTSRRETNNTAVIQYEQNLNPNQVTSPRQKLSRNTENLVYADLDFQSCPGRSARIKRVVENTVYSSFVHYDAQGTEQKTNI